MPNKKSHSNTESAFLEALSITADQSKLEIGRSAREAINTLDFPTRKTEAWKYTRIKSIIDTEYAASSRNLPESVKEWQIPDFEGDVLVFVNGQFMESLSDLGHNEDQILVSPISKLDGKNWELFEAKAGKAVEYDADIFTALNTAHFADGCFLYVPKGKIAKAPVHLIYLTTADDKAAAIQTRNLFLVEDNAQATVVETCYSIDGKEAFTNAVNEVFVGKNASIEYAKIQNEGDQVSRIDRTEVRQERDSRYRTGTYSFSGNIVRNHLAIWLDGENCESELMGASLLSGREHVDNYTQVHHLKPNCLSNELYKSILDEKATGVFNGKIHVYKDAQKTNAFQSNRNILLSDTANAYTRPQLEIYADDVKCSHGATTGRLDEEALFYLMARGIPAREARLILIHAFAMETTEAIHQEAVASYIQNLIETRF